MTYVSATPLVGCLVLIALAVLIGTFALPLLPLLLLVLVLWWLFGPKPVAIHYGSVSPKSKPEPAPGDDIPASEAVIDVKARVVEESEKTTDNDHIGG